jgi:hypothetical protein
MRTFMAVRTGAAGLVAWAVHRANTEGIERQGELPPPGVSAL